MNKLIKQFEVECWNHQANFIDTEKFAELLVQEIVNTLEFHGYEEAIPYIKWMAINKLGIGE